MTDTPDQTLVPATPLAVGTPSVPTGELVGDETKVKRDELGRILPGSPPLNPEGIGGIQERPEDVNTSGRPKNQESFTYWINHFKKMSQDDFLKWDEDTPDKQKTVASALAYARVFAARTSLKDFREVADRSEGKSPQTIIFEGGFFSQNKLKIVEVTNDLEAEPEAETGTETA